MTAGVFVKQASGTSTVLKITNQSGSSANGREVLSADTQTLYAFGAESFLAYNTSTLTVIGNITTATSDTTVLAAVLTSKTSPGKTALLWSNNTMALYDYPTLYVASQNFYNASFGSPIAVVASSDIIIACYTNVRIIYSVLTVYQVLIRI